MEGRQGEREGGREGGRKEGRKDDRKEGREGEKGKEGGKIQKHQTLKLLPSLHVSFHDFPITNSSPFPDADSF